MVIPPRAFVLCPPQNIYQSVAQEYNHRLLSHAIQNLYYTDFWTVVGCMDEFCKQSLFLRIFDVTSIIHAKKLTSLDVGWTEIDQNEVVFIVNVQHSGAAAANEL